MAMAMAGSTNAMDATRCSACNMELDLASAGDHVCSNGTPLYTPRPLAPAGARFNHTAPLAIAPRIQPSAGKLPKFAPPARIDPFAANEAFLPPPQTAPGLQANTGVASPARVGSPASSRFRMPPRSATTPHFHDRPKSPVMRMPQDSAFPVFPTKKVREERAKKDRQRSKSMSRSQSRERGAFRNGPSNASALRSASPAVSTFPPRPSTAGGMNSRKNSTSSTPSRGDQGSFGISSEPVPPLPGQHDASGLISPKSEGDPFTEQPNHSQSPLAGPIVALELEKVSSPIPLERTASERSAHFKQPSMSAAIKPLDAIGSTRRHNHELGLSIPRSQSASGHRADSRIHDAPPVPEVQSAVTDRRPSDWISGSPVPDSLSPRQQPLPLIEDEAEKEVAEDSLGSLPSFKASEGGASGALNKPRMSTSSDGSSYSATHSVSSRSSPPTSASSFSIQENLPKGVSIDNVLGETQRTGEPALTAEPTLPVLVPAPAPLQQRRRGPAKSFSRPNYARPNLDLPPAGNVPSSQPSSHSGPGDQAPLPTRMSSVSSPREIRQAPNVDGSKFSPSDARPLHPDLQSPPTMSPMSPADRPFSPMSPRTAQTPGSTRGGDNGFHPPRRPTTPGFKGNCRGCGEMIVGKSVSSADGRLTGRYHKQCFVCRTCKEPFQTADFYVINNQPYCQRHYHTLNGSLCNNCDRGIEGPYMETDASKKFHPHCFTCKECHLILRNDYFEINGVIYCEKHSRKPDLLGPGRQFPERRRTRLMMM